MNACVTQTAWPMVKAVCIAASFPGHPTQVAREARSSAARIRAARWAEWELAMAQTTPDGNPALPRAMAGRNAAVASDGMRKQRSGALAVRCHVIQAHVYESKIDGESYS